ncbi:MAG: lipoprotein-releasing system ATP-binding protein [Acidobacteriota bacterium]|nr:lipoprotein-releasing system ATP-binding protein [Acidobacteriota bacterium]
MSLEPEDRWSRAVGAEVRRTSDNTRRVSSGSRLQTPDSGLLVEGLRKTFASPAGARIEVLRGVSFAARAGELLAIVGASGAGKSTLLHACGGLDTVDSGIVRAGPFDVTRAAATELIEWRRRAVGFIFQFHHLLPALSALENVELPLRIARRTRREAREAATELLEAVGLADRASHLPGELSGGEQQRVAIARALASAPPLVLADEPTGNLDARTGAEVGALLARLARERGACVLVATHNERLARLCDRTLTLADGRLAEPAT